MPETLLQTKLYIPPLRPNLVERPHLVEQLNRGIKLGYKLTLVTAPAGFGKTTLVSSWIHQLNTPAAWLSLDDGDNTTSRFIFYIIAALKTIDQALGETTISLLQSPQPRPPSTLLAPLINDLAILTDQILLVLDDYHVVQNLEIHQALTFLLDYQPPQLHLVIVSREDPALPLHRLRGSGQMSGIYVRDLRFKGPEVTSFFTTTMGLTLSKEDVATLARRTEGWVAGLQLAAISMLDMPDPSEFVAIFAGDDRYISDYLIGEVFERQPVEIQEFLLRTCIFTRFCASLCTAIRGVGDLEAVTGSEPVSSQSVIDHLARTNLFIIPLDNKREWYRYHPLFVDFLQLRLSDRPADQISQLHQRAADWFAKHGPTEEAIQHYLTIKDFDQAADLIAVVGIQFIVQGQLTKMLDWLAELPDDIVEKRSRLCVYHAWILTITGQGAASEPLLKKAEKALETIDPEQAGDIKGLIDMLRAYQARRQSNMPRSIELLHRALKNISPDDLRVRSTVNLNLGFNYLLTGQPARAEEVLQTAREEGTVSGAVYVTLIAMAVQANSYVAQGKLHLAVELYEEAIADGLTRNRGRPFPPAGYAYAGLGQVMYEQNRINRAEQLLTQAAQLGESIADWSMARRGLLPLVWLKQMTGEPAAARKLMQRAYDIVRQAESERLESQISALRARLELKQASLDSSALDAAIQWADNYQKQRPDINDSLEAFAQLTLAQVELAQGKTNLAISRLNQLADIAAATGQRDNLIKIQTLQALAYHTKGDAAEALDRLGRALALASSQGYLRTFVDHGPPMQHLLQEAARRGPASEYVSLLLSSFPAASLAGAPSKEPGEPLDLGPLLDPPTKREISILRLMAAGRSNREIANELFLSVNTVKVYASRIYSKLGVHRRGEAVARARELGLL